MAQGQQVQNFLVPGLTIAAVGADRQGVSDPGTPAFLPPGPGLTGDSSNV